MIGWNHQLALALEIIQRLNRTVSTELYVLRNVGIPDEEISELNSRILYVDGKTLLDIERLVKTLISNEQHPVL